jgi:hypothetical protein
MYKNTRKVPGAFVWHKNDIARITNQKVEEGYVLIENRHMVSRSNLRLVRVGQEVVFKNLDILPDRCRKFGVMKVVSFLENGIIRTDKDEGGSAYSHLVTPNNP